MEGSVVTRPNLTLSQRYEEMNASDFATFITAKWNALEQIVNEIRNSVDGTAVTPREAGALISCAVSEIFGYKEFHAGPLSWNPQQVREALLPAMTGQDSKAH